MPETRLKCPSCEAVLKLAAPLAPGKAIKCPKCAATIRAPAAAAKSSGPTGGNVRPAPRTQPARKAQPEEEPDEEIEDEEEAPRPKKGARRAVDEDEEQPRKRKRRKKGGKDEEGSRKKLLWIGIGGGAALLVGIVVLVFILKGSGSGGGDGKGGGKGGGTEGGDAAFRELDSFNTGVPKISDERGARLSYGLAVTRDGKTAVVSAPKGGGKKLRIFDIDQQKQVGAAELNVDFIHQVRISPDKSWLACYVNRRETIELRDLKTGTLARVLKPEKQFGGGSLEHVAFAPRSDLIVGVDGREVFGWDCKSGRQTFSFKAHEDHIVGQAFLPDGRLVTSGQDQMIKIWDLSTKTAAKTIRLDEGIVEALVVSPDGKLAGSMQRTPASEKELGTFLAVWDLEKGTKISRMQDKYNLGRGLHFLPGNKFLAAGGGFHFILWDVASGTKKVIVQEGLSRKLDEMIYDFDVTENGTVFIFRWDGRLQRWAVKE